MFVGASLGSESAFLLRPFLSSRKEVRALLIDRETLQPSIAASVYESALHSRCASPNTFLKYMRSVGLLFSWARDRGVEIDELLLSGSPLEKIEVQSFAHWLEERYLNEDGRLGSEAINTFNGHLTIVEGAIAWFVLQYFDAQVEGIPKPILVQQTLEYSKNAWRSVRMKRTHEDIAPDLEDDEIRSIDTFLRSQALEENPNPKWVRGFLIWRLAIELGLRIGEILSLRLQDCPGRGRNSFRIVRIAERKNQVDPRGIYSPRPKTLSRELAPVLDNTAFPALVTQYQSMHRVRRVTGPKGRKMVRPVVTHQFLIVSDSGAPLAVFTARGIAKAISAETGVKFSWHLARHAFFNRAYSAVAELEDPTLRQTRLNDLVYWGGWKDADSLAIYSRRARADRARNALAIWGGGARSTSQVCHDLRRGIRLLGRRPWKLFCSQ